ncbi:MAG: HAD family phosphatase [Ruminiclostridium sp.]|nr:HAD family phosphatase [Ruminiclostridium sp.]MBQ9933621.1 HAD family phosphatase [Ruminiclostridium sp.]
MANKIKLIALDLDATLLDSRKKVSQRNLEALERARQMGILMVPVTGRPAQGLPQAVLDLPGLRYAVTSNGATVRDLVEDRYLLEKHLTPQKSLEVLDACRDFVMIREVFREGVGYLTQADYDTLMARYAGTPMWEYVLGTRQVLPGSIEDFLRQDDRPVEELFFLTNSPAIKEALRERLSSLPDIAFADPFPKDLEVMAGGIDKGEAFLWLLDHLGIRPEETIAMGDGGSDIPLLRAAGIGIAMDNALDYVKAAADDVTASCDADGVAQALEKYIFDVE